MDPHAVTIIQVTALSSSSEGVVLGCWFSFQKAPPFSKQELLDQLLLLHLLFFSKKERSHHWKTLRYRGSE